MNARQAKRIACSIAADLIAQSQAQLIEVTYSPEDAVRIREQLDEVIAELDRRGEKDAFPTQYNNCV